MKIADVAAQYGMSKQAIYQRIKRAGMTVDQLTDRNGEIHEEGLHIIGQMLTVNKGKSIKNVDNVEKLQQLSKQVESLTAEIDRLTDKLNAAEAERDYLRTALSAAQTALNQEQQLQAAMIQRMLPAPREGIVARLCGLFRKGEPDKT